MNCREAQERMTDLLDASAHATDPSLHDHLEACPVCEKMYSELKKTLEAFPAPRVAASTGFTEAVMNAIQDTKPIRQRNPFRVWRAGLAAAAALVVCAGASFGLWYVKTSGTKPVTAFRFLGEAVHAMARVQAMHIKAEMRTLPNDNFEMIALDQDMVPVELWADFSEPLRWRVEKPGRIAVLDGEKSTLFIRPNMVARAGDSPGFVGWMTSLINVEDLLSNEVSLANEQGSEISLTYETSAEGETEDVLRVEAKAQGTYVNDWLKDSSIADSDNLRVYRFEPETKLLKGLEIYVHTPQGDVLVFETKDVSYDLPQDETLFALQLPEDAVTVGELAPVSDNEKYAKMDPREAAQNFFQACAQNDWDEMAKYWFASSADDRIKQYLGGLQVIELGSAFQSGLYPGWFIPYEIKLKDGSTKKHNLAMRNDNDAHRYVVDGGI
ncbi:MAG: hypothetical protein K1Y02_24375 [Candidatus Hydrogenedentes bacterium]|nr:hypothetical protein [Candidatus Hydrogenedentota bacterium]